VLAGGYAINGVQPPPPVMVTMPTDMTPTFAGDDQWASRAQVALSSVSEQLDTLAEAEQAWSDTPAARREAPLPPAIVDLLDRRELLEQQQATLQSQLDDYAAFRRVADELHAAEEHLRAVDEVLAAVPAEPQSREQAAAVAELNDQRAQRQRQLTAREAELRSLQENLRSAVRIPLPDDGEVTERVRDDALEAVERAAGSAPSAAEPASSPAVT
jgi:hypothetical protein